MKIIATKPMFARDVEPGMFIAGDKGRTLLVEEVRASLDSIAFRCIPEGRAVEARRDVETWEPSDTVVTVASEADRRLVIASLYDALKSGLGVEGAPAPTDLTSIEIGGYRAGSLILLVDGFVVTFEDV